MSRNCSDVFLDRVTSNRDVGVLLFSGENCQGETVEYKSGGEFQIPTGATVNSILVPENFRVTFYKTTTRPVHVTYDRNLWGGSIDNVHTSFDIWNDGANYTYSNLEGIDVRKLGSRENVLSNACVGTEGIHITGYEPLSSKCEEFLDVYCMSDEPYTRDLCRHRKTHVEKHKTSNPTGASSVFLVFLGLTTLLLLIIARWVYFRSLRKRQRKLEHRKINISEELNKRTL
jgi:hypothetical protein